MHPAERRTDRPNSPFSLADFPPCPIPPPLLSARSPQDVGLSVPYFRSGFHPTTIVTLRTFACDIPPAPPPPPRSTLAALGPLLPVSDLLSMGPPSKCGVPLRSDFFFMYPRGRRSLFVFEKTVPQRFPHSSRPNWSGSSHMTFQGCLRSLVLSVGVRFPHFSPGHRGDSYFFFLPP